jgi:hypothetical protein
MIFGLKAEDGLDRYGIPDRVRDMFISKTILRAETSGTGIQFDRPVVIYI